MSVLTTVLLDVGILALLEGTTTTFFPKFSLKFFRLFAKNVEKHIRVWGISEMIIAVILIYLGLTL